jgi:hypothetical protein
MKKTLLILCALMISSGLYAEDAVQSMHDAFARGFEATKAKNKEESVQWFQKAGQYAVQAQEWKGCLDAGSALLKLGQPADAASLFDQASNIAQSQQDWRIGVAVGYAYASLPPDLNKKEDSKNAFVSAASFAKGKNDWMGMTEAANGLVNVGYNDTAASVAAEAKQIVDEAASPQGAEVIAELYKKLGMNGEAQQMATAHQNYVQEHEVARRQIIQPPPGWSPVGESVAGPWVPSPEQQKQARESADKDIEAKNQWILQQEQIEAEHKKEASQYSSYYYYPYGYSSYTSYEPWDWDMLVSWADSCGSSYVYTDGYYHHNGDYSGFGFAFGYSDGNTAFGFSIQSYDY